MEQVFTEYYFDAIVKDVVEIIYNTVEQQDYIYLKRFCCSRGVQFQRGIYHCGEESGKFWRKD
jgi:hypothetical protein